MNTDSNVAVSDENALTKKDGVAGEPCQQTSWPPALVVRLPGVVEHLVEKRDRDRARWLGGAFDRPATTGERVFLVARGALRDPSASPRLATRVAVRGAVRRRTWPMLDGAL
ncbi:hypothetical protein MINTM020_37830 [Mycobacterium paraintracellulare]|uniref:hypothetical protein n=1 Tax=Mycobacterium paraintracellulare TaxID=1138383 RepID=UPI001935DFC1|nr:hypothetical protein [Mycobacterium paraintracellulare]BCP11685.1 hypothetical protein MINTM020_37830 [Mycobacterium paraintracellulare]